MSDSFGRARAVYWHAIGLSRAERSEYLEDAYERDPGVRDDVEAMLAMHTAGTAEEAAAPRSSPSPNKVAAPECIGDYRVLDVLGRGGMGVVYRAEQAKPRRVVALKVLQPGLVRGETLKRFEQEAQVLGLLQHPGIAAVYDAGSCDFGYGEMPFFAMELVEGPPLTEYADAHGLGTKARCALIASVCDAVQHAHERGIVHRDLKPSNVLVAAPTTATGAPRPKILDFGIARTTDPELQLSTMQTRDGQVLGTLRYMSPEQVSGRLGAIDARSDVYSLGVMLYELLAGRLPLNVDGLPLTEIARVIQGDNPTQLGRIDRALRGDLETICDKALAKEPEWRYLSAADFAEDLRRYLRSDPIAARRQSTWYQLTRFARRNRALVAGVLATLLVLIAGLTTTTIFATRANRLAASERSKSAELRHALYRTEMRLASEALLVPTGAGRIRHVLERWIPEPNDDVPDLRGWEWHLLNAHATSRVIRAPDGANLDPVSWLDPKTFVGARWKGGVWGSHGEIYIVDVETGRLGRKVCDYRHWRRCSRDGTRIAVKNTQDELEFYDLASGELVRKWRLPGIPRVWDWSPSAELVAVKTTWAENPQSTKGGGRLVVRRADTGEDVAAFGLRFDETADCLGFSADGRWLAAEGPDQEREEVRLIQTSDWSRVRSIPARDLRRLRWHPRLPRFAVGYRDGSVQVFDADSGERLTQIAGDGERAISMNWRSDGEYLAIGSIHGIVRVFEPSTGRVRTIGAHGAPVRDVAWSPDGKTLATGARGVRLWNLDERAAIRQLAPPSAEKAWCSPLSWHPNGAKLLVGINNRTKEIDVASGAVLQEFPGWGGAYSPDGKHVARQLGSRVSVWRDAPDQTQPLHEVDVGSREWFSFAWHPSDDRLAFVGPVGFYTWQPGSTEAPRHQAWSMVRYLCWHPAGHTLCLVNWGDKRDFADSTGSRKLQELDIGRSAHAAWSPVGTTIAFAMRDHSVLVGDPREWSRSSRLVGHLARVGCVAWSPDGRRIASGGHDRTVRIWEVSSRSEVLVLEHAAAVVSVAWSPDGSALASLSNDGCVKVWDAAASLRR